VSPEFELFLFSADPATVAGAAAAGVSGFVVDWERVGKRHRQAGADTQIGENTVEDLARARAATSNRILCRIDNKPRLLAEQVEAAIARGADEILVPMVRSADEVEHVRVLVAGRCGVGLLIETEDALVDIDEIATLVVTRAYVGLNDLAIERGTSNIFEPLVDGTVESIRRHLSVPFGVAGLTVVDGGRPIPCRLLVGELVRLDCTFSFLRRSYHADIRGRDHLHEIARLREALDDATRRTRAEIRADRDAFVAAVQEWAGVLAASA
jgi:2-keto-3-deoxy-L-rhamnonate aldolase RhmA